MGVQWSQAHFDERPWDEKVRELYSFLVDGELPDGVKVGRWRRLSPMAAMSLIWFLQEIAGVLPDNFEQCATCKEIFDTHSEGTYDEKRGRSYCDNHIP